MSKVKLFNKWDTSEIEVKDLGLKKYINLEPVIVPRTSHGRHASDRFSKSDVNIVERLINQLLGPGHRGRKHKISSDKLGGNSEKGYKIVKKTLEILEDKLERNPVEVLVRAVENAALREEVTSYQVGSIIARKAVTTSPQRGVDLALRYFVQGAYSKTLNNKKSMSECLAEEILAAYNKNKDSFAIRQKERMEREAAGAR